MTKPSRKPRAPGKKPNMREQVYTHLRTRMQKGEIGLDDRLVDHEIATELSVSRMPVREALMQLKNEGLLEGTSRGFVLRRFTPTDITQIFEVRLLLEPAAAAQACKHATLEAIALMNIAAEASEKAHNADDIVAYMAANSAFRSTWITQVPNPHLVEMINRLAAHFEAVRLATLRNPTYRASSLESTQRITAAFLEHDPQKAIEGVQYNLRSSAASYYAMRGAYIEQTQGGHQL
ncbi:MAG: GntR family transcriptional regulator [Pusillimonas sp.]